MVAVPKSAIRLEKKKKKRIHVCSLTIFISWPMCVYRIERNIRGIIRNSVIVSGKNKKNYVGLSSPLIASLGLR